MKFKLIEDARSAWRLWSLKFAAIGAAIMSVFAFWPDSALYLWAMMPREVRALIPEQIVSIIALVVFGLSALSRIVKQKPRNDRHERDEQPNQ